jgi:hypothetical protein
LLCPPFIACVEAAFPKELRDLVYSYLWDEDCVDFVDEHVSKAAPRLPKLWGIPVKWAVPLDWVLPTPFFADTRFVGEQFAREAATWYFRHASNAEVHYRLVRAFFGMEKFGDMSFRPRDVIRRLTIEVAWSIYAWHEFAYADFRENMEYLLTLPVKDDFEIVIYLPRDMQFSRLFFHVLDTLKPIYKALVEKGMRVKVLGYQFFTPSWKYGHDSDDEMKLEQAREYTTAEQLNCYFDMTPETWFTMQAAEISAIRQPQRRAKCFEVRHTQCLRILRC